MTQTIKNGNGIAKKFRDINADDNTIPVYNEENGKNLYRLVKPLVSLPIMHTAYRCYENKVIGKH